ncbi:Organ specific protein [Quillaja saponaria]|uniref:Organ specific protein n=1 Tax=Quillaja saponaria TaxID=32244 RepID=A0AAD7VJP2_QUISA|nr:Organ specific protein [Quillaja saponaria]
MVQESTIETNKSKKMKSIFASFIVFSLLLFANLSYARNDLDKYWKSVMKNQPMPGSIKDLLHDQDPSSISDARKDKFVKDFDMNRNLIIYQSQEEHKKRKPSVKKFEPEPKMELKKQKVFVEHIKRGG